MQLAEPRFRAPNQIAIYKVSAKYVSASRRFQPRAVICYAASSPTQQRTLQLLRQSPPLSKTTAMLFSSHKSKALEINLIPSETSRSIQSHPAIQSTLYHLAYPQFHPEKKQYRIPTSKLLAASPAGPCRRSPRRPVAKTRYSNRLKLD